MTHIPVGVTHIAVVGGGGEVTHDHASLAEKVGRAIAEAGAVLVCGGLGGVMEASCRGAHGAGGMTVGILPGRHRSDANPYVSVAIPTGLGEARNALVVRAADAVVAVAGEYGTLSEIALALQAGIPVVGLDTWELVRRGQPDDAVVRATDPAQAVALALEMTRAARREPTGP
ncbi:MAG TPA: TIGR00725 family protein [Acidimicrobiales bacterium]|nr:TIGR00725 family protein [Acidimicrobiales bacterium]